MAAVGQRWSLAGQRLDPDVDLVLHGTGLIFGAGDSRPDLLLQPGGRHLDQRRNQNQRLGPAVLHESCGRYRNFKNKQKLNQIPQDRS